MVISVICPVLNEGNHIEGLMDFFIRASPTEKEFILIDGGSHDNTVQVIEKYTAAYANIRLLYNPDKIVAYALNLAIPQCRGKYIVRLDGHSNYADDYFERIIDVFVSTGADIVGGPTRTAFNSSTQEAIAFTISHPLGIGGSSVHDESYEGYSDSVTFGAWRKEIFDEVGYFDQRLVRNQDDEFHYRAKSKGFKIYQSPSIKLYYYPRKDFKGFFKQYFQYGLYKPLVLKKVKSEIKLRHLIPAGFVVYLATILFLPIGSFKFLPLLLYTLIIIATAFYNHKSWEVKFKLLLTFPCIHIAYGLGFVLGCLRIWKLR